MELPSIFRRYRNQIDQELRAVLASADSSMYDMLRYQLGWIDEQGNPLLQPSGKALRPTLCLFACEALSGDYQEALPAAAAVELVHNFSLIHDDIQDDDRLRRNRPTVWAVWGKPQAINAGTAMRVLASASMMRLSKLGVTAEKLLAGLCLLDESCLRLIEGQYLDISFEQRLDIGVAEYLKMAQGKTSALISCSLELGASLATQDDQTILAFRDSGVNLGLAFQIRDDLLGVWGNKDKLGKPIGSDILRKKKSYPIVYALEKATGPARQSLLDIYQRPVVDERACSTVLGILEDLQVRDQAQSMVNAYSRRASSLVEGLFPSSWGRDCFEEIICFLTNRDY